MIYFQVLRRPLMYEYIDACALAECCQQISHHNCLTARTFTAAHHNNHPNLLEGRLLRDIMTVTNEEQRLICMYCKYEVKKKKFVRIDTHSVPRLAVFTKIRLHCGDF